jgi:putative flippase GtrA
MWILVSFAIVALVIFLVMILLKIEPIISMVVSVLTGLIIAYFMNHLTITYNKDKYNDREKNGTNNKNGTASTNVSTNANIATNVPTTHIQSSDSSTANLSNSNSFGFFQTGK